MNLYKLVQTWSLFELHLYIKTLKSKHIPGKCLLSAALPHSHEWKAPEQHDQPVTDETYSISVPPLFLCYQHLKICDSSTEVKTSRTITWSLSIIILLSILKNTAVNIGTQLIPQLTKTYQYICGFMKVITVSFKCNRHQPANLSDGCHGLVITYFPDYNEQVSNWGSMWGLNVLRPAEIKIRSVLSTHRAEYKLTCPLFEHFTEAGGIFISTLCI